jgi:hypothetical protein
VIINGKGTNHNQVLGNFIGTDVSGTIAVGNGRGIAILNGAGLTTVGGTTAGARNVISGNGSEGVFFNGSATNGNKVLGNFIGADISGAVGLGNAGDGISFTNLANLNDVGGTATGAGNVIAFNGGNGVFVDDGAPNRISRNSIFANFLLGIDLNTSSANNGQSAPNLTSAVIPAASGNVTIKGSLFGAVGKTFTIEFFVNATGDPQGKKFLGSLTVTIQAIAGNTHPSATQNFTASLSAVGLSAVGDLITATATDANGNTSEYSNGQVVSRPR